MKSKLINVFGWYGTIAIVLAYFLVSFSFLSVNNIWYQILKVTGSLGIVTDAFYKKDYQPGVLNIIWIIIAAAAIVKMFK